MIEVTQQKCACADCVCIVPVSEAVKKDERNFCSKACAEGHCEGSGCGHAGCACKG